MASFPRNFAHDSQIFELWSSEELNSPQISIKFTVCTRNIDIGPYEVEVEASSSIFWQNAVV